MWIMLTSYNELKEIGYTGISTQYFALNKETDKEELFPSKDLRDISVKTKTHNNPTQKSTDSKQADIIKNISYAEAGKYECVVNSAVGTIYAHSEGNNIKIPKI